jgi:prolyl-tRNA synthetase
MEVQSLTARIQELGLTPAPQQATSTQLSTYFFTPKSGSKHPNNPDQDLKLVIVTLEQDKNVGAAKQLASQVGLKDMRAISAADLDKLISRTRDQGKLERTISNGPLVDPDCTSF